MDAAVLALIFDLDGTLVDSMPAHLVAWRAAVEPHGLALSNDAFVAMAGMSTVSIIERLCAEQGVEVDVNAVSTAKDDAFLVNVDQSRAIEPIVAIARRNHGVLPMAVGTGNVRRVAEATLAAVGIADLFDALVAADDVANPKPAPDTFLEAARRLGVEPSACRVFEDGEPGIVAARAAGMDVVDVRG